MRILARWPIRTKFYAAMVMMLTIVLLLFVTGLQGVYAYRRAANAISGRASEMPMAQRVAKQSADLLRATDELIKVDDDILGRSKTTPDRRLQRFRELSSGLLATLAVYRQRLESADEPDHLLDDRSQELATVKELEQSLQVVHSSIILNWLTNQSLRMEVEELDELAQQLPTFFQQRMAGYRDEVRGKYRAWTMLAWSCGLGALTVLVLFWWLFRRMIMQPFRQLMCGCRRIGAGDFSHRIYLNSSDELDELAHALNGMADRFQRAFNQLKQVNSDLDQQVRERTNEVVQNERLASVGFLAAGVSHEINNPMAAIAWSAEALESRLHDVLNSETPRPLSGDQLESLRDNLRRIQQEAFRCKEITDRLLDFSRLGEIHPAATELRGLVKDVAAMVSNLGQFRNKIIRVQAASEVHAMVNAQEIKQVVLNLLTNALQSLGDEGQVVVRVWRDPDSAHISVEDNGCGMTDEVRQHLFEPFFTRRVDGRGTGLGLSISYRIVQQHGGRLVAHSDGPGLGTRMDVQLPTADLQANTNGQRQAA